MCGSAQEFSHANIRSVVEGNKRRQKPSFEEGKKTTTNQPNKQTKTNKRALTCSSAECEVKHPHQEQTNKQTTHHSISNRVSVGSELGVDVGEEPTEGSAAQPGSQGLSLRNISNVDARVLKKNIVKNTGKKPDLKDLPAINIIHSYKKKIIWK